MTDSKYNTLVTRIVWFTLPLVIGLLAWIVVAIQTLTTNVSVMQARDDARELLQADTRSLVAQNNDLVLANHTILMGKADQKSNEDDHAVIVRKIDVIRHEVENLSLKKIDFTLIPKVDTNAVTVLAIKTKMDTACTILQGLKVDFSMLGIFKESSIVSTEIEIANK